MVNFEHEAKIVMAGDSMLRAVELLSEAWEFELAAKVLALTEEVVMSGDD